MAPDEFPTPPGAKAAYAVRISHRSPDPDRYGDRLIRVVRYWHRDPEHLQEPEVAWRPVGDATVFASADAAVSAFQWAYGRARDRGGFPMAHTLGEPRAARVAVSRDGAVVHASHGADWEHLGARLAYARTLHDRYRTQERAADAIGVPRSAIAAMEAGVRKVYAVELGRLCHLYGVHVDALLEDLGGGGW